MRMCRREEEACCTQAAAEQHAQDAVDSSSGLLSLPRDVMTEVASRVSSLQDLLCLLQTCKHTWSIHKQVRLLLSGERTIESQQNTQLPKLHAHQAALAVQLL